MRQLIWATLTAAVLVSIARAQTAPDPIIVDLIKKDVIVVDPPPHFLQPCSFIQVNTLAPCPKPAPAVQCQAGAIRCANLANTPGRLIPL
jgi:hypothetical protein